MRVRLFAVAIGTLVVLAAPAGLLAQVGHPPRSTPYRDIRKGHTITALSSYFAGNGGRLSIGPHAGYVFGGRYDIRTGSTIQLGLGISWGSLDRFIVDPSAEPDQRSGPFKQSVTFADLNLQFNLTGGKSWNRFAPFVAAAGGLAIAGDTPADNSGYDFGNEFYFAPAIGTRVFLGERLHLRAEARLAFWKLSYPSVFENTQSEWVTSPWFQVGVGYAFSP